MVGNKLESISKITLIISILALIYCVGMWTKEEIDYRNKWITYAHSLEDQIENDSKTYEANYGALISEYYDKKPDIYIPELSEYYYNITNETSSGKYYPTTDTITLFNTKSNTTILHEIGHRIWWTKLNDSQKAEWTLIHDSNNETVTEYALTNEKEDFAETFEYWYSAKEINSTLRYSFIQNNKAGWE